MHGNTNIAIPTSIRVIMAIISGRLWQVYTQDTGFLEGLVVSFCREDLATLLKYAISYCTLYFRDKMAVDTNHMS